MRHKKGFLMAGVLFLITCMPVSYTHLYRFKIGTIGEKKPEDWIVVEGQHEPLIDRMSFDIVQNKLKSRQLSLIHISLPDFVADTLCLAIFMYGG